jgi:hypothetical protein
MILKFKNFLSQTSLYEEHLTEAAEKRGSGQESDTEGKLFEILSGYHLNGKKHMNSYREEGKLPEDIHNEIKSKISPQAYQRVNQHAMENAANIRQHLKDSGYEGRINHVVWTSQGGDIKHFTGQDDPNNESDVMINFKHGLGSNNQGEEKLGYSMKYANNAVTLKNKTPKTFGQTYGIDEKPLMNLHKAHMTNVRSVLNDDESSASALHQQYKEARGTDVGNEIERSSNDSRKQMVKHLARKMGQLKPQELHDRILDHIAGPTNSTVFMAHTNTEGKNHILSTREHYQKILKEHKPYLKVKPGAGTSFTVTGKDGQKLLEYQVVSKGRPTQTPEIITKPGAALAGK